MAPWVRDADLAVALIEGNMNLEIIAAVDRFHREKREADMQKAFQDDRSLLEFAMQDSARILAGLLFGYRVPLEDTERQAWIMDRLHNDHMFCSQVQALSHLLFEYARTGR